MNKRGVRTKTHSTQKGFLRPIVAQFRCGILDGQASNDMCFAVCAPLQGFLSVLGYDTKLVEGEIKHAGRTNHFWLELPDGTIIDLTADQFFPPNSVTRMPKVYIGPKPEWYLEVVTEYPQTERKSLTPQAAWGGYRKRYFCRTWVGFR